MGGEAEAAVTHVQRREWDESDEVIEGERYGYVQGTHSLRAMIANTQKAKRQ